VPVAPASTVVTCDGSGINGRPRRTRVCLVPGAICTARCRAVGVSRCNRLCSLADSGQQVNTCECLSHKVKEVAGHIIHLLTDLGRVGRQAVRPVGDGKLSLSFCVRAARHRRSVCWHGTSGPGLVTAAAAVIAANTVRCLLNLCFLQL
jgi:hypothetical protein